MDPELNSGPFHMAADVQLLANAQAGEWGLRVYEWDGLWVSLGRNQVAEDVLLDAATPTVTRPTGGAAVLHGHDVTVSIAMPLLRPRADSYRIVTAPLIEALRAQGLEVALAESASGFYPDLPDCFATTTKNDLIDSTTRQKVCGCALRRTREAVLLQASIPVREPLAEPASIIRGGVQSAITPINPKQLHCELKKALAAMQ
ncbi:MAG: hypothetical protein ACAH95_11470 [Fimbriimonas sp.]